jgi:methylenetetrahydrofolate dehydrogenase (NADP+)/methenyltetrahydrofolate cyclohydrolase
VLEKIIELNGDEKVSGIIVQLPLPEKFQMQKIINSIDSRKDVDGFHPENEKSFLSGGASFWPVFPHAIIRLLESSREKLEDKKAVVVANSQRFGEVMVAALRKKNISGKYILAGELKNDSLQEADIVITACGTPGKITGGMVKNGAIIIDGGITRSGDKTVGDVDFESVHNMAGFISPVPGGVGPVTIACLLENVYLAAKKAKD